MFKCILALAVLSFGALAASKSVQNTKDLVWFPNPNNDGSFIPAQLTPTPGAKVGDISDVHFQLYTRGNPDTPQEIMVGESVTGTNFIEGAPVKLLIHGFGGGPSHTFPWDLRAEFLKLEEDLNIIILDWEPLSANPDYFTAVANAQIVSEHAAKLLDGLVADGSVTSDKIHLIGFSLGGQVVGQIGYRVSEKVARITALDPALPLFDVASIENRTDSSDAEFVDCIHTSANGILGYWDPIGHVDFYPNGGRYQPGCGVDLTGSCGHGRAPAVYIESVLAEAGSEFQSRQCETYEEFKDGTCDSNPTEILGYHTPTTANGIYFLDTDSKKPFSLGPLE